MAIAAAKAAHVHSFVKHLPDGYEMELNEEASNVRSLPITRWA